MRRLVAGIQDGRSCIVEDYICDLSGADCIADDFVCLPINPPLPRPPGRGDFHSVETEYGKLRQRTIYFPPHWEWKSIHHSDSIDIHTVMTGTMDLILEDGPHTLVAGDCVAVMGVDHSWKTGPEGGLTSCIIIATPPP